MWPETPVQPVVERLFKIPNKKGEIVPFNLNLVQKEIHDDRALRKDILKSRQFGVTYFIEAAFLVNCLTGFCRCVMIAHDKDHTEKLLQRVHLLIKLMNGPKPIMSKANEQELYFQKTNATFYIGTAGAKKFGRSDTITHLHGSEVAFWPEPKKLIAGLLQAVPHDSGCVIKECTANGYGTYHHRSFMNAWLGRSTRYKPFFFPWYIFPEYQSQTPLHRGLSEEERALRVKYETYARDTLHYKDLQITDAQFQWRREKVEEFEGDVSLFNQEYPGTVEEAFLVTGGSLFPEVVNEETLDWEHVPFSPGKLFKLKGHPVPDFHYVFGVDVSGGTGNDYSTVCALCVETQEQVLTYSVNTVKPPSLAELLLKWLPEYNKPLLVPEQNQHGLSVIDVLEKSAQYHMRRFRIYASRYTKKETKHGFKTTNVSKFPLIGVLMQLLPYLTLYDPDTVDQLRGFGETEDGKLGNVEAANDDLVIALALASLGIRKEFLRLGIIPGEEPEEMLQPKKRGFVVTLEDIKERIHAPGQSDLWLPSHLARYDNGRNSFN